MKQRLKLISPLLLPWYRANARALPWRNTADPYRIWVSEIMLQQTRVAVVLGYYDRFLTAFPDVYALANADEEQLMKLWEGLGYYSRARNMQKAAKAVVEHYAGQFPESYGELLSLSGIGEYTAGAIASAAFGARVPAVDGNVLRVISRITENWDDISDAKTKRLYRDALFEALPESPDEMRIFNQAVMEIGATVCVPNGPPKCNLCPVRSVCLAAEHGTAEKLPIKMPKKARRIEEKTVFVLLRDGAVALRKRDDSGLLAGLWEFPNTETTLDEAAVYEFVRGYGLDVIDWKKQLKANHIFTHIEWHMTGYVLQVKGKNDEFAWADKSRFSEYAIPSAFARFIKEAESLL